LKDDDDDLIFGTCILPSSNEDLL